MEEWLRGVTGVASTLMSGRDSTSSMFRTDEELSVLYVGDGDSCVCVICFFVGVCGCVCGSLGACGGVDSVWVLVGSFGGVDGGGICLGVLCVVAGDGVVGFCGGWCVLWFDEDDGVGVGVGF